MDPNPDPNNPDDDDNFGITVTFDLNGGYINRSNQLHYAPIVLRQEVFNDYYYEFDIIGNENKDHLNNRAIIDAYGAYSKTNTPNKNYNGATGINVVFGKSDGSGGLYRLSGWSLDKGAIYPDYKANIDGITNINFDTFDSAKNANKIKICNDLTLYAIWEPVLQMNVELTNVNTGEKAKTGTLTAATQENMRSSGLPELDMVPGQSIRYLIYLRGENKATTGSKTELMTVQVEFDDMITGIYANQYQDLHDGFNKITSEDRVDPNEEILLATSNLNRKLVKQPDKSIIRKFSVPLYLGTDRASALGYNSFKEDGYSFDVTASRLSNFYKGEEKVTAKLLLVPDLSFGLPDIEDGDDPSSGGGGGNSGGSGNPGSGLKPIISQFKTNIRIQ